MTEAHNPTGAANDTDITADSGAAELAARLARLQARRETPTIGGEPTAGSDVEPSAAAALPRAAQRPRRAVGTKIGTLGASATALFGLMALYGVAEQRNQLNQPDPADQYGADQLDPTLPPVAPGAVQLDTPGPEIVEPVPVEVIQAVVVVDEAGNVLSAPADLDPAALSTAVAQHQQQRDQTVVAVATTVPVPQPVAVDLAIPAPPPPPRRSSGGGSGGGGGGGGGGRSSSGGSRSQAPAPAPAPAPQAQSSGS